MDRVAAVFWVVPIGRPAGVEVQCDGNMERLTWGEFGDGRDQRRASRVGCCPSGGADTWDAEILRRCPTGQDEEDSDKQGAPALQFSHPALPVLRAVADDRFSVFSTNAARQPMVPAEPANPLGRRESVSLLQIDSP